jgi:N-acetylmuramoyl-L-alanine amidase
MSAFFLLRKYKRGKNEMEELYLACAGHTNNPRDDRGAAGNGFIEGIETLKLRDAVALNMRLKGLSVIEDGADGVSEPLTKACLLARKANVAFEFHFNAGPSTATGIEVLCKPSKKTLAQQFAKAIGNATGLPLRGDKGWKADDSGQHHRLAFCEAGGLIVEVCFISNKADMTSYQANFQKIIANITAIFV